MRRWLVPILESNPPRWLGTVAAAALLLASAGYGAVEGGHAPVVAQELQDICDSAANSVGFHISSIALSGEHELGRDKILALAGITGRSSLLFLDATAMRGRLTANPWIASATVLKFYPGRLQIEIKERKAFALWQKDGNVSVISADGIVLQPFDGAEFSSLPLVVGVGAAHKARSFLATLASQPDIAKDVEASILVADRRWNLRMKNGIEVRLPESDPAHALATLAQLDRDKKLLTRDIVAVDLRLPDRVSVTLSDAAAQARDTALKDAAKKNKKKGGDA